LTIYFTAGAGFAGQPIVAWPNWYGDPFVLQFTQLVSAAAIVIRRAAAISLARAAATYTPSSYQDAVRVRDLVGNALEAVIDEAGDLFDDRSYEALTALRVAVIEDLKARGGDLAQIVNRGFGGLQPALVLAYRLYRDATRADEVLARNDCAHPGFLPAQLELLAA
jgi:prophage DNA circulation protein